MALFRPTGPAVTLETERFVLESLSRGKIARASFPWTRIPEVMTAYGEKPNPTFREWRHLTPRTDNRRRFSFAIRPRSSSETLHAAGSSARTGAAGASNTSANIERHMACPGPRGPRLTAARGR